jgi:hypothetical protein
MKHSLKDLTLHRLGQAAFGTLLRILGALLEKGSLGKDEKKTFRFVCYFLGIIVEDRPEAAHSALQDFERTTQSKEVSMQLIGHRIMARLCAAMGSIDSGVGQLAHGPRPRLMLNICAPLIEVRPRNRFLLY